MTFAENIIENNPFVKECLKNFITTLSGGFLVTNWLVRKQRVLRDIGVAVFCQFNSKPT